MPRVLKRIQKPNSLELRSSEFLAEPSVDNNLISSRHGKAWSTEELDLLFSELRQNIDINRIAEIHERSIGGIDSRRRLIAYQMYLQKKSMEEIMNITKLDEMTIQATISRRDTNAQKKNLKNTSSTISDITENTPMPSTDTPSTKRSTPDTLIRIYKSDYIGLQNDVREMKNEIRELHASITELSIMMKALY